MVNWNRLMLLSWALVAWAAGPAAAVEPAGKCADYVSDATARELLGGAITAQSAPRWTAHAAAGQTIYECHWLAKEDAGGRERELYLRVHDFGTKGALEAMSLSPPQGTGVRTRKLPPLGDKGLFWWHLKGGEATVLGSKGLKVLNLTINRNFEAPLPEDVEARLLKIVGPLYRVM